MKRLLLLYFTVGLTFNLLAQSQMDGFSENDTKKQTELEDLFLKKVDFDNYKNHLKIITANPHTAGSKANEAVRDYLMEVMGKAELETTLYPYDVYIPKDPGDSEIAIVTPKRKPLNQMEDIIPGNAYSSHPDLPKGWNAYSGSGEVTAEVVYANYGTKEDYEKLAELGISIKGKIVLARYGKNFRGFKAKYAEQYGAAGLLIFTDPGDYGYSKGLVYPEGNNYSESAIQRGSVLTESFTGDPLTPFEPALPLDGKTKVDRLDPSETSLHTIPITPIGYGAASEIMSLMKGKPVPGGWQGGLPFTYRLEGGSELTVRLSVTQPKEFVRVNNVVGTVKGSLYPDEWIILGCHYDAWAYGVTDPGSGTAMLLTLSEALGELVKDGYSPKRSIMIAHWDAEEYGVIGSTEWVEQMKKELGTNAVAYLNFDAGVSGRSFGGAAAPSLKKLMTDAAKKVIYPDSSKTVFEMWSKDGESLPIGNLGGGSDHIGFYMHAGVPSLSGGTGGKTLYHTNYDDFFFYEKFIDPSLKMGGAVAQWAGIMSLKLANATLIPYDLPRYATDLTMHFKTSTDKIKAYYPAFTGFQKSISAIAALEKSTSALSKTLPKALNENRLNKKELKKLNADLIQLEKSFLHKEGMPFGPWYLSLYASSDPYSGYASWILPAIEFQIANAKKDQLNHWDAVYEKAILNLNQKVIAISQKLESR
ncbi:M28 family peptidase [Cyclobacterium qasimii]|uniref:Glutamate carboxypeptidase II n=2 Tax=Cyclobacterium qasimii TaxID=1350429 RepID=S7VQG1_9BACT|nr:M28 family peptidase [Cyclobacterium qasimii]EPR71587.1 Glutamate carboxypeptidase II precursor [Cyclobacterium qasimii M12-11B]GEO20293.1 folate hydrolase [Cyclobacterium qasimii]